MSIAVTAAALSQIIIHLRRHHAAEVEHYNASWTAPTLAMLNWTAPPGWTAQPGYQAILDSGASIYLAPEQLTTLYEPFRGQTIDDLASNSDTALHSDDDIYDHGFQDHCGTEATPRPLHS